MLNTPTYKITYKNGYVRYSKHPFGHAKNKFSSFEIEKSEVHECKFVFLKVDFKNINGSKVPFFVYKCDECGKKYEVMDELCNV